MRLAKQFVVRLVTGGFWLPTMRSPKQSVRLYEAWRFDQERGARSSAISWGLIEGEDYIIERCGSSRPATFDLATR